jgi:hypothetical protein
MRQRMGQLLMHLPSESDDQAPDGTDAAALLHLLCISRASERCDQYCVVCLAD